VPPALPAIQFEMALPDDFRGSPALSPDGTMLAYHSPGPDGRPTMFVRRLDAIEPRAVPGTDMTTFASLIWSHDSRYVAFSSGGVLKRARVPDGPVEEIAPAAEPLGGAWNADGVLLLGSRSGGLRRLSRADRTVSEATTLDRSLGDSADRNPWFLPDGRHFMFRRLGDPKRNGIWIGSLDPQVEPRRLTDAIGGGFAGDLAGLGPTLLLLRDGQMFAQQMDLDRLELIGEARPVAEVLGPGTTASQTGVLAYIQTPGTQVSQLRWYDRAGGTTAVDTGAHRYQSIDLSPDGRRLSSTRSANGVANLWLTDLTRGSETRITTGLSYSTLWSPDGAHIVFNRALDGLAAIHRKRSNGTGAEEVILKQDRDVWANDWSRDGRFLLYSTTSSDAAAGLDVGYLAIDDPQRQGRPYLAEDFTQKQAQFSPDGRYVAYISDESSRFEVYVRTFPDPNAGKWPISVNGGVEPRWSRDGRELFYWSGRTLNVVAVKTAPTFEAGPPRKLFDAPIQAGYVNDNHRWQVSPDGQRFLVLALQESAPATIRVIVNWPSLLQRP
jgi:Tol biopolymer transport system component